MSAAARDRQAVLLGLALVCAGAAAVLLGLGRLGWRRHRALGEDFAFLHLDWVAHRELPQWRAHVGNLSWLAGGLISLVVGIAVVAFARHEAARHLKSPSR